MNKLSYDNGHDSFLAEDYKAARREFAETLKSIDEHHECYYKVASYLGLAQVLNSDRNGLLLCRDAASSDARDADLHLNLACAEWHVNNRQRAVEAINRGREIDANHQQLVRAARLIDPRKRRILPFLARDHYLNRLLGRMMCRNGYELTVHQLLY